MRTRILSLLLVAGLAVAACGGDDDTDEGPRIQPSDETAVDTTAPTG